jgi:hypothetical protein
MEVSLSTYLLEIYSNDADQDVVSSLLYFPIFAEESRLILLGWLVASLSFPSELTSQPAYNTLLGVLVFIKGLTAYRRELLYGSNSQLRDIVIR